MDQSAQSRRPLGPAQTPRRNAERVVRKRVVAFVHGSRLSRRAAAQVLGLDGRTVGAWTLAWRRNRLTIVSRGRRRTVVDPAMQSEVQEVVRTHGRAVGIPALKGRFPRVPRSALHELRRAVLQDTATPYDTLVWTTPGVVWSTDFTRSSVPIDGAFNHVLMVRDLASACTLLALPCLAESARMVADSFTQLFARHGPPLVLKSDNGSPFIAGVIERLCVHARVAHLRSPALTPRYNGSIESTAGCLKTRAAHIAGRSGRAACWSSDDIEAARLCANALNRPWGVHGPTPDERWDSRPEITPSERDRFLATVEHYRQVLAPPSSPPQNPSDASPAAGHDPAPASSAVQRSSVDRAAIRRALVESGSLTIRRPANTSTHSSFNMGRN